MEIPEIGVFEAGIKCLQQSPSYFYRLPSVFSIQMYSFWKWGALILAFLATFTRLLKQIKFLIRHIRRIKPSPESLLQHLNVDLDLTDDDDSFEPSDRSSEDEGDEPKTPSTTDDDYFNFYTDFGVKDSSKYSNIGGQNGNLRSGHSRGENSCDSFKWSDFSTGKNVVKIWDRLGMSFGFESFDDSADSESVVSLWDFNKDMKIREICRRSPQVSSMAVTSLSPAVVLSSKKRDEKDEGLVLEAYDTRVNKSQTPVSYAEWSPFEWLSAAEEVTVTSGGVEKVYVGDVAVGDMRKLETPLNM